VPLPDADPPDKSRIYEELKSKTALPGATGAVTPDLLDNLLNQVFVDADNEDELRRHLLVGMASRNISVSGPIPNTLTLEAQTFTSQGYKVFFTPGVGEIWQIMGVSVASSTGLSGTGSIEVDINNPTTSTRLILADFNFTSSSDFPVVETGFPFQFVDENHQVRIRAEGTFTSINDVTLGMIRVR